LGGIPDYCYENGTVIKRLSREIGVMGIGALTRQLSVVMRL
jgi:hypothetical protein